MDKQHWHAALACSVGLQCWDAEWTYMIDEQHATVAFTSSMGVQHRHSGWAWSMSVALYHVVRLACMSILHAVLHVHAAFRWREVFLVRKPAIYCHCANFREFLLFEIWRKHFLFPKFFLLANFFRNPTIKILRN
jgi:hypothetical protein